LIGSSHGGRPDEASEIGAITSCWREGIIVYFFRGEWSSGWSRLMSVSKFYTSFVSNHMLPANDPLIHDRCLRIVEMSSSTIECQVDGIVLCGLERLYTHPSLERSCPRLVLPLLHLGTSVPLRSHYPSPPLVALLPLRTSDSTLVQIESDQLQ
jgi:hypothetical protein